MASSSDPMGNFLDEVSAIEKRDEIWTAEKQIHRLTKPGSSYLNLNPYEVLLVQPGAEPTVVKKQFRKLSILVHPDKNRNNLELATTAFEIVNNAKQTLDDEDQMRYINSIILEAKEKTEYQVAEKKKKAKKKGVMTIDEDDHYKYQEFLRKNTVLMFADNEKRKKDLVEKTRDTGKAETTEKDKFIAKKKVEKEKQAHWDSGATQRLGNWQSFAGIGDAGKKKKKKKVKIGFKPPKLRDPSRLA
eukprot:m.258658 g.258658  ORF g.258658 m.258658 type:complete len:245 (-) comp36849_c0_seq1:36-770(-)